MKYKKTYFLLSFLLLITPSVHLVSSVNTLDYQPPRAIHLSFQENPETSMSITWITPWIKSYQPMVEYGTSSADYTKKMTGETKLIIKGDVLEMVHTVSLTGLKTNTSYYYHCGNHEYGWSNQYQFTTADVFDDHFRFVALGDSRTNITQRTKVIDSVKETNPSFILHTGDLVSSGAVYNQWNIFFDNYEETISYIPLLPCIGNHDTILFGKIAPYYYKLFALPDNEHYYSFDYKNVHVIMANSEERQLNIKKGSEQYRWLEADLVAASTNPDIEWIIVGFHRPPYNSGTAHGNDTLIRKHWCPLFDTYQVDLVISGHEHCYERTYPMMNHSIIDISNKNELINMNAPTYLITGGAGAPLYETPGGDWVVAKADEYHFCMFDVFDNHSVRVQVLSVDHQIIDEFWMKKGSSPIAQFSHTGDQNMFSMQTINFIDESSDTDGSITTWNWMINDEMVSTEENLSYYFADDGLYNINLSVTDDTGFSHHSQMNLTILNRKPIVNFSCDQFENVSCEQKIHFQDFSFDEDGNITSYEWFCDNKSVSKQKNLTYSFDEPGCYSIGLKITDDDGAKAVSYQNILVIDDTPPVELILIGISLTFIFLGIYLWKTQKNSV